jgi:SAM-dependent methyltransferase
MAVEPARENFRDDPDVLIVQGDILNPPFREATFDAGYSIGVLHHTPDPARGLEKLAGVTKEGGQISCSVYEKAGLYGYPSVGTYRSIHNATNATWEHARPRLCLFLGPLHLSWPLTNAKNPESQTVGAFSGETCAG